MQSESEQRPHKLSYHLSAKGAEGEAVVKQLEEKLAAAGVSAKARLIVEQTNIIGTSDFASACCLMSSQAWNASCRPARLTLVDTAHNNVCIAGCYR